MTDEQQPKKKRWPWYAGGVATAVVIGLVVAFGTGLFSAPDDDIAASPSPTVSESQGSFSASSAPPSASPSETPSTPAAPLPEPGVAITSVNTMPYSPVWNPPDRGDSWWQIVDPEHGYPQDGGTDYVLAHACPGGTCAGDRIRMLDAGDTVEYRGELYVIEQKLEIQKTEIADQDIWTHDPNRVVVITCIIDPATGESHENDILIATRA